MKAEIKILHAQTKLTKEGKAYEVVHVLIRIEKAEFIRKFYLFNKRADLKSE